MKSLISGFLAICIVLMGFQGYAADINCVVGGQCDQVTPKENQSKQSNQQVVQEDNKINTDANQQVASNEPLPKQRKCKKYAPPPSSSSSVLKDIGNTILDVFMVVTLPFAFMGGGGVAKLPTVKTSGNSAKDLMKVKQQRCLEWEDEAPTPQTTTQTTTENK